MQQKNTSRYTPTRAHTQTNKREDKGQREVDTERYIGTARQQSIQIVVQTDRKVAEKQTDRQPKAN